MPVARPTEGSVVSSVSLRNAFSSFRRATDRPIDRPVAGLNRAGLLLRPHPRREPRSPQSRGRVGPGAAVAPPAPFRRWEKTETGRRKAAEKAPGAAEGNLDRCGFPLSRRRLPTFRQLLTPGGLRGRKNS